MLLWLLAEDAPFKMKSIAQKGFYFFIHAAFEKFLDMMAWYMLFI